MRRCGRRRDRLPARPRDRLRAAPGPGPDPRLHPGAGAADRPEPALLRHRATARRRRAHPPRARLLRHRRRSPTAARRRSCSPPATSRPARSSPRSPATGTPPATCSWTCPKPASAQQPGRRRRHHRGHGRLLRRTRSAAGPSRRPAGRGLATGISGGLLTLPLVETSSRRVQRLTAQPGWYSTTAAAGRRAPNGNGGRQQSARRPPSAFHGWRSSPRSQSPRPSATAALLRLRGAAAPDGVTLHASATAVTGAFTAAVLAGALMAVPVGRWLDRHGGRALMTIGSSGGDRTVVAWSQVRSVAQLYAVFAASA